MQPLIAQVRAPAARPGRRAPASSRRSAAPSTRSPASSAPARRRWRSSARRGASAQTDSTGAAARRNRHRQGAAGARASTRRSARAAAPFVSVNIAAVPDTLLEAEFFGVAPGAYTGADRKGRDGKFKLADGGTLFLDEIGDMPLGAAGQAAARAAGAARSSRWARNKVMRVDVRVIAATCRDLPAMVRDGQLPRRPVLPPQRAADPRAAAARAARRHRGAGRGAGRGHRAAQRPAAARARAPTRWRCWRAQRWPRQHPRAAQRAGAGDAMRSDSQRIDARAARSASCARPGIEQIAAAPMPRRAAPTAQARRAAALLRPLAEQVAELERQAIAAALAATGGNKLAAARLLGHLARHALRAAGTRCLKSRQLSEYQTICNCLNFRQSATGASQRKSFGINGWRRWHELCNIHALSQSKTGDNAMNRRTCVALAALAAAAFACPRPGPRPRKSRSPTSTARPARSRPTASRRRPA